MDINKDQLLLAARRSQYKKSLYKFFIDAAKQVEPSVNWDYCWFYEYLCTILQAEAERIVRKEPKKQNLIFNLPFRAGKSTLISQIFPVWCWVLDPQFKIMTISANQNLANRHSEKSLLLIQSAWFKQLFPHIKLTGDAVSEYSNTSTGTRLAFGMSAKDITGSGANIVILDDPQTPDDLTSTGIYNTINIWKDKIYSRNTDPLVDMHILLQQRLHQQDLSGYLLENDHIGEYKHICIPAILNNVVSPSELKSYYKPDLSYKETSTGFINSDSEDLYFWLPRFGRDQLAKYKANLGSKAYAGQLLMKPQADEGGLIKPVWFDKISMEQFREYVQITESAKLNRTNTGQMKIDSKPVLDINVDDYIKPYFVLDTANTTDKQNDPTAMLSYYYYENKIYVFNVQTVHLNPSQLNNWVINNVKKNGYKNGSLIQIENAASGPALLSYLGTTGYRVVKLQKPHKDKIWRANQCLPEWEGGRIVFIDDMYVMKFVEELAGFPDTSPHDDMVDCLIHATEKHLLKRNTLNYKST